VEWAERGDVMMVAGLLSQAPSIGALDRSPKAATGSSATGSNSS